MQRSGSFERRSSVNRRPSPSSSSPIHTPSSRTRTPSPSRGRPQSFRGSNRPSSSRPLSRSRSRGRSSSRSSSHSPSRRKKRSDDHDYNGLFKTTAGLLAGIGVATVIAHKVWPKGVLHGDHEDWEHPSPKHSRKHQHHRRRSPENAERVYERTTRRHGDVVYHEEVSRRRPQNYERMPQEHVRIRQHAERLPYTPDDYYIQEQPFYPAERRRTVAHPAPYPPEW